MFIKLNVRNTDKCIYVKSDLIEFFYEDDGFCNMAFISGNSCLETSNLVEVILKILGENNFVKLTGKVNDVVYIRKSAIGFLSQLNDFTHIAKFGENQGIAVRESVEEILEMIK